MEIFGYSERGAMNALFYGIAFNNDMDALYRILEKAEIKVGKDSIGDVQFFMEFSMSEFGSPDLLVTFKANGKKHILFIEAKASCGKKFDLNKQYQKYKETEEKYNGYSSNLYYQLEMKHLFFEKRKSIDKDAEIEDSFKQKHKIGNNFVVNTICEKIKACDKEHYIAIVPQSEVPEGYPPYIKHVFWEDLYNSSELKPYLKGTWEINGNNDNKTPKSQIANN